MGKNSIRTDASASSFEDFVDEIVIIHNTSGVFYSLRGRAMSIWRACVSGVDNALIEERIAETDAGEQATIHAMMAEFTGKGLLVQTDEVDNAGAIEDWSDVGPAKFERNDDFDDLIKLDPIHDVDDRGWPHRDGESA